MLSEKFNEIIGTLRFSIRCWIGRHPLPFVLIVGWMRGKSDRICNPKTTIVIESYPRSANTYCVACFQYIGENIHNIASHQHASAQLVLAKRLKKPVLVIIRSPLDSILSLKIRREDVSIDELVREYCLFNKDVYAMKDSVLIAKFETVISDISCVISKINDKFSTGFDIPIMDKNDKIYIEEIVDRMDKEDRDIKKYSGANQKTHSGKPMYERKKNPKVETYIRKISHSKYYQEAEKIHLMLVKCSDV